VNKLAVATKELTRKEQLKKAFKTIVLQALEETGTFIFMDNDDKIAENASRLLLREVSIRTNLK